MTLRVTIVIMLLKESLNFLNLIKMHNWLKRKEELSFKMGLEMHTGLWEMWDLEFSFLFLVL